MKTMLMAVMALVLCSAVLFAQPSSNARAEEKGIPIALKTRGKPSGELSFHMNGQQPSGMIRNAQSKNTNSGETAPSETDTLLETELSVPTGLELGQNYPNPFNSDTEIKYGLPVRSSVQIAVYNIFGQRVRTIKDAIEDSGYYSVSWDGRNDSGDLLASGMYFYVFASDDNYLTRKMLLLK